MEKIKVSILVVDDEPDMLWLCVRILRRICDDVEGAGSSAEARAAFRKKNYDLLLTDINIDKEGNGVELAAEIRSVSPSTRVVIMTANPSLASAIGGLKSGAMEYIVKPFANDYLESVVRNVLEKSRLFSELEREKELRGELQAAYEQLKYSEKVKDAFLARINHELRTPLAVAMAAMGLLGGRLERTEDSELWARGDRALKNLGLVIDELLLFSGLLGKGVEMKASETDLDALLEEAAGSLSFLYGELGVKLSLRSEGASRPAAADPSLISSVFKQLLTNAARFNVRGGSVSVTASYLPDRAVFSFRDTGRGVPEEAMPRIFDGFFQAADYLTREVGGIGLGLATVKRIVEAHGGGVSARRNSPGPGMTFTVSLPLV